MECIFSVCKISNVQCTPLHFGKYMNDHICSSEHKECGKKWCSYKTNSKKDSKQMSPLIILLLSFQFPKRFPSNYSFLLSETWKNYNNRKKYFLWHWLTVRLVFILWMGSWEPPEEGGLPLRFSVPTACNNYNVKAAAATSNHLWAQQMTAYCPQTTSCFVFSLVKIWDWPWIFFFLIASLKCWLLSCVLKNICANSTSKLYN